MTRHLGFLNPSGKDTPYVVYEFMEDGKSHATELKNNEFVTQASDYSHNHRRLCEGNILLNKYKQVCRINQMQGPLTVGIKFQFSQIVS